MTITLELTPEEERRVAQARAAGVDVDALLKGTLSRLPDAADTIGTLTPEQAAQAKANEPAVRLLQQWREEDAAMTDEEGEQAEADWQEPKANLNANRAATGERPLVP
jgi:hypothetical protein